MSLALLRLANADECTGVRSSHAVAMSKCEVRRPYHGDVGAQGQSPEHHRSKVSEKTSFVDRTDFKACAA